MRKGPSPLLSDHAATGRRGTLVVVLALFVAACGSNSQSVEVTDDTKPDTSVEASTTTEAITTDATTTTSATSTATLETSATSQTSDPVVEGRTATPPVIPRIPPIVLPDVSSLTEAGDRVAESLGELASPAGGIEVVGATCDEGGGELQYDGSIGTDVFDIKADGSGTFYDESPDGLTTLEVRQDGTGRYYDESGTGLVTISVEPDRSGEYYQKEADDLVTVRVDADQTGEYYDETPDRLLTITLDEDGSGRLYDKSEKTLLTVDARGDGSGEYYSKGPGELTTIVADADGAWEYIYTAPSRFVTLEVEADGTGAYDEAGLNSIEFEFDSDGRGPDGERINLPPTPEFVVASEFPPLGELGSLAPPCATVIRLDSKVLFDLNQSVLRPEAAPVLAEVVTVLAESDKPIDIVGHTDSIGSDERNQELSLERARAVEAALRARGLDVGISVDGRGASEPVAPNETPDGKDNPAGRAQNRRVDITIRE